MRSVPSVVPHPAYRARTIRVVFLVAGTVWSGLVVAMLLWTLARNEAASRELARLAAAKAIDTDYLYRVWATRHGGVYVPVSEWSPPNPYLTVAERDVVTTSGLRLTLVNPAYMTRQVHALLTGNQTQTHVHITSLRPLNPANEPDAWDKQALEDFERGAQEVVGVASSAGAETLRMLRPMFAETGCLKCHAAEGFVVGRVSGGLGTSVHLAPYRAVETTRNNQALTVCALLWLLGLVPIAGSARLLSRRDEERERLTEQLMESQRVAKVGNFELDMASERWTSSPVLDELLGGPHQVRDLNGLLALVHPDARPEVERRLRRALQDGEPFDHEFPITRPGDAEQRQIHGRGVVGQRSEDHGRAMTGTMQDVTEHRRLEQQLNHAQKLEAVGQLAGGVAHDFNNILASVLLQTAAIKLKDGSALSPATREGIDDIEKSALRAAELTRRLLMFGRRQVMTVRPLDLNGVVEEGLKMPRRLLGENITIEFAAAPAPLWVSADQGMLEQVLMNLCVNARDAMPAAGGRITLATRRLAAHAELTVSDTGQGMDAQTLDHLFEPFFTTKQMGKGTGLGLAIVHGAVKQHGGDIEVESQPNRGTTFRIRLPLATEAANTTSAPADPPARGGDESILLVEDEALLRRPLAASLRQLGYRVTEASDGAEALEAWARDQGRFQLVLSDMTMPGGISGLDLVRRLRLLAPPLRVILMSGYSTELVGVPTEKFHFIAKPFAASSLSQKVRAVLDEPTDQAG